MLDYKKTAKMYGISDKIKELEKALSSVKYVTEVTFDLTGFYDNIFQVVVIAGYEIDNTLPLESYYKAHSKVKGDIIRAANRNGLMRTEDRVEDMGAHWYIVFSARRWNEDKEFALFYEYKGREIPVGSEGWVPTLRIANNLIDHYELKHLLDGREVYIKARPRQREYIPMLTYKHRAVQNKDYCFWNALKVGDYIDQERADYIINCYTPASMRTDCTQMGEPAATKIDDDGNERNVYITVKKIADGVWEYCGRCFRGENTERGTYPAYI